METPAASENKEFDFSTSIDKDEEDSTHLTWKEKYELCEQKLSKFHKQAGKVRELLAVKMKDYEGRVIAAEMKRDEALEKLEKMELSCQDKDEAISALREKITRLREERNKFVSDDEEKMSRIKDWVKSNMTEVLQQLATVRKERDQLKIECDRAAFMSSRRSSEQRSDSPVVSPLYEEIFGELLNDLRKDRIASYQSIDGEKLQQEMIKSSAAPSPPNIPPRGRSFHTGARPPATKPKLPIKSALLKSSKQLSTTQEMFNLQPDKNEYGSLTNLSEEVSKLAKDENAPLQREALKNEPSSPVYFMLQAAVNGMEFDKESVAPVYSTLQGRNKLKPNAPKIRVASLIRDRPFTGETSDSDCVEHETEITRTANNLPAKKASSLPRTFSASTNSSNESVGVALKTCAPFTSKNMREETLEKAGWLVKLGGRVKNWKRRWFTLSEGKLNYFKSRGDMYRKPIGMIDLKQVTQLSRNDRPLTFEITTPDRTYYLTADNSDEVNDWLRVLRNGLRRFSGARVLSRAGDKTVFSGWVTKAKYGVSKYCWAVLKEKSIIFYQTDVEQAPIGAINLREVINVTPVKEENRDASSTAYDEEISCKLMIQCLKDSHPTYFIIAGRSEMELWLHQIQNMCSSSNVNTETDFEQVVTKLMNIDGDAGSRYWRSKIMIHEKDQIKESLSSLQTTELEKEATNVFKSIQLFSTTPINETAVDYHISLAQDIIKTCLTHPELQTEIYCQLIKQTSKYRSIPQEGGTTYFSSNDWLASNLEHQSGYDTIDMNPVSSFVYMQCWQLLALCTSIFLPKLRILWLLKAHLHRNGNESSDIGRYAIYCQRSLERTLQNGERETRPSRLEAISLVSRNPYYRIYPMSIPVYLLNGSYQIFSFDGSTTVFEFTTRINEELGLRNNTESGFALFTDNPVAPIEHCLQPDLKICDVISKWEQACQHLKTGRFERSNAIKLTYKCRLFFKSLSRNQTEKEKFLHVYMINESLRLGHLLPKASDISKLTALLAQLEFGDYVDHFKQLEDVMQKIYPNYTHIESASIKRKVFKSVADFWSSLKGRTLKECVATYISIATTFKFYGCKMFKAQEKLQASEKVVEDSNVWISVDEDKLELLSNDMQVRLSYEWRQVVTFGGYKEDFMVVVQPDENNCEITKRYLFAMPQGRVLEVTFLIASYINAVVKRLNGFTTNDSQLPMGSTDGLKYEDGLQLWDMECEG